MRARSTGWPTLMRMLVQATLLTLMLATSHLLAGDPAVSAARWIMYGLVCTAFLLRPRHLLPQRRPHLLDALAIALVVLAAASALYSTDPALTLQRAASLMLMYVAVFWTMWSYADIAGDREVSNVMLQVAAIVFVAGVANVLLSDTATIANRYRGVLVNPNAIGMLTIVFLPLAIAKWVRERSMWAMLLAVLIATSVVFSGSRNGVVTASAGIVFMLFRVRAWRSAVVIAALGVTVYLSMPDSPVDMGRAATSLGRLVPGEQLALAGGRVEAWEAAIPIIRSKIVLGHGFGTEEAIFRGMSFRVHRGQYVHNSYLGLTYQLGLAGSLLLFTPLVWMVFRRGLARRRPPVQTSAYEAVLFGGLIASFFESWIYSAGNAFAFPFWTCMMLLTRAALGAPETADVPKRGPVSARGYRHMRLAGPGFPAPPALATASASGIRRFDPPSVSGDI